MTATLSVGAIRRFTDCRSDLNCEHCPYWRGWKNGCSQAVCRFDECADADIRVSKTRSRSRKWDKE